MIFSLAYIVGILFRILRSKKRLTFLELVVYLFPINLLSFFSSQSSDFISPAHILVVLSSFYLLFSGVNRSYLIMFLYLIIACTVAVLISSNIEVHMVNNYLPYLVMCAAFFSSLSLSTSSNYSLENFIDTLKFTSSLTLSLSISYYLIGYYSYEPMFSAVSDPYSGRLVGPFIDASVLCLFALVSLSISGLFGIIIAILAMALAGGDGAIIVGGLVLYIKAILQPRSLPYVLMLTGALVVVVSTLSLLETSLLPSGVKNITNQLVGILAEPTGGMGGRFQQMETFLGLFESPGIYITGAGFGAFNDLYHFNYGVRQSVHNSVMQFISNFGIFNSILITLTLSFYFYLYVTKRRSMVLIFIILVIFLYGMFHNVLKFLLLWVILALWIGEAIRNDSRKEIQAERKKAN